MPSDDTGANESHTSKQRTSGLVFFAVRIAYILSVNDPEVEVTLKDEVMEVSCTGGHTPASSTDAHAQSANALHQDMPSAFQDIPSAFPV